MSYDDTARICTGNEDRLRALGDADHDLDEETWVPKSVIHDDSEVWQTKQEGDLIVHAWWARKAL